jgi:hypothetical protein
MGQSILKDKSFSFALQVVRISQELQTHREYVLSKQILRSGTSIGALVREAEFAQSKLDFINKLSIVLIKRSQRDRILDSIASRIPSSNTGTSSKTT